LRCHRPLPPSNALILVAPVPANLTLTLIPHGESAWSLSGRHTGRTDIPLTARGEEQARELAPRLGHVSFAHVFTSPRQRARQTCALAGLGTAAVIEPDLAEWDYGDYEGQRSAEILAMRPGWNIFRDGCPHGETPAQISARADRLLTRLRALEGNIALFTHGHFGRVLSVRWIGLPVGEARSFLLGTGSVSVLGHEHDRADEPVIALWNATTPESPRPRADETGPVSPRTIQCWENEGGGDFKRPAALEIVGWGALTHISFARGGDANRRSRVRRRRRRARR
jgi:broad specificity phosphatase PhoE